MVVRSGFSNPFKGKAQDFAGEKKRRKKIALLFWLSLVFYFHYYPTGSACRQT